MVKLTDFFRHDSYEPHLSKIIGGLIGAQPQLRESKDNKEAQKNNSDMHEKISKDKPEIKSMSTKTSARGLDEVVPESDTEGEQDQERSSLTISPSPSPSSSAESVR